MKSLYPKNKPAGIRIPAFIWLIVLGLFASMPSIHAQEDDNPDRTIKKERRDRDWDDDDFRWDNRVRHGAFTTYFFGFDLGINGYLSDGSINLPSNLDDFELNYGRSWEISFHLVKQRIKLFKNVIRLEYGPEINLKYYRFTNDVTLLTGQDQLTVVRDDIDYKKNRLRTTFLTMPLMLDFKVRPKRSNESFRFAAGGYVGLLLSAGQKQKSDEFGVQKVRDDFNLNKFRYGVMTRIGFGDFGFFAKYSLNPLFRDGEGPELYPFTIGLTFFQ